jgi:hypothetical protein
MGPKHGAALAAAVSAVAPLVLNRIHVCAISARPSTPTDLRFLGGGIMTWPLPRTRGR